MPSSNPDQINEIMQIVLKLKPDSVLDIGTGFGKYGFLCREYLEICFGSDKFGDWQKRIDGIEIYEDYITPLQKQVYTNLYVGDANDLLPKHDFVYDLILLINVLEHFSYDDGIKLLQQCRLKALNLIISTPKNIKFSGAGKYGNIHEATRFQWREEHFGMFPEKYIVHNPRKLIYCIDNTMGLPRENHPIKSIYKEKNADYYDTAYEEKYDAERYTDIYRTVLEWLGENKESSVLEVGCGCGDLACLIVKNNIEYQGFDFSQKALDQIEAKSTDTRKKCTLADAYDKENYKENYNTVIAIEVMEHLDDLKLLNNVRAGTRMILSLPDYMAWSHLRTYDSPQEIQNRFGALVDISKIETFVWGEDNRFHLIDHGRHHPKEKMKIYLIDGIRTSKPATNREELCSKMVSQSG